MENASYIVGDSRQLKEIFDKNKIQAPSLIITSPPYFDLLNYENNKKQLGYGEKVYEKYIEETANILQDCYNLSTADSSLWLIIDSFRKKGEIQTLPFDINNELKKKFDKTWKLREIVIWDKEKNLPWTGKGKFRNLFEYILFFTKSDKYKFNIDSVREIDDLKKWWKTYPERYNPDGKAPSNVWRFITPIRGWGHTNQDHLCPFPYPLVEKIISISSKKGDVILDPFAGSGSMLAIASLMDRKAIGIDINEKYKDIFGNGVQTGAKAYWEERRSEIKSNLSELKNFKETNRKLRLLKVGVNVSKCLSAINKISFTSIVIGSKTNEVKIYLVSSQPNKIKTNLNEKTKKLIEQSEVIYSIEKTNKEDFLRLFKNKEFYKYGYKKFYHYSLKQSLEKILDDNQTIDSIYSNIELEIK